MLLNAYRAIFKSAYFKGMASAVILTAGLAAGAANAEDLWSGGAWPASGDMPASGGAITVSGDLAANGGTVVVNDSGTSITVAASGSTAINVSGNGSLRIVEGSGDGAFEVSVADGSGSVTVDLNNIEILAGQKATISNEATSDGSGATLSADVFTLTGTGAQLTISASASGDATLGQSGGVGSNKSGDDITVSDGAKVILSSTEASGAAIIAGSTLTLDGGVIESSGSTSEKNQITTSYVVMKDGSVIRTDGSGSTLTINLASDTTTFSVDNENDELNQLFSMNGGYIKVASGDTLKVDGQTNFNQVGGTIELGGNLEISATSGNPSLTISTDDGLQAVNSGAEVTVGSSGALTITSQALQNFLEDDDYSRDKTTLIDETGSGSVTDTTAHLKLSGGALNFSTDVNLNDFKFSGSSANETIEIASGSSSINADGKKLTMADVLETAASATVSISASHIVYDDSEGTHNSHNAKWVSGGSIDVQSDSVFMPRILS